MNGPRIDLVIRAAQSRYTGDFEWLDERVQRRIASDHGLHGFTPPEIRNLAQAWIRGGGEVLHAEENRHNWRYLRDYYYWVVIPGIDEFPRGLFVEMAIADYDETDPIVSLLNAHESSFSRWGNDEQAVSLEVPRMP